MTASEQVLLTLIKQSLFHIPAEIPENVDWNEVYQEAKVQAILGLINKCIPKEAESEGRNQYYHIITTFVRILTAQKELVQLLSDQGIPCAILKGSAAAIYYPEPYNRTMGDVDFIVAQEYFDTTAELMIKNGYKPVIHEDKPSERHLIYQKNGIIFELHHHFSYEKMDVESFIIDGLQHAENAQIMSYSFPMLPPLANGLVLLIHIWEHLHGGLGLRQVIDWMLYVDKVLDDDFWKNDFEPAAKELGIDTLAISATRMCQIYLGLSDKITWCQGADEKLCEGLMGILLSSGNFGRKQADERQVEDIFTVIRREGLFHYLQFAGEKNWKAYKRHSWLKPFCWAYQIFRYCYLGIRKKRAKDLTKSISMSKKRAEILKQLRII